MAYDWLKGGKMSEIKKGVDRRQFIKLAALAGYTSLAGHLEYAVE
jgi:hypothetical protein